ncbi:hypothetical protein PSN45_002891 [Yamadazyma tenuis]|uniref:Alpha/beta hydrolase fold-3 domain-containing protein n=1 Tax=Candida tenuis (strain ATCC 10573 / BCRC 21748 / CBS 615 / JCM 9827 / NBRC 10315 / NRRL Y-1498 / VKM Y-70) TaxID=590646 RepID=G3AWD0_CANTC|nr:uncharacterized protein CANTEDRAFT_112231 [Yamadazyma tenuis ATCC 10573]XP_006684047.1 uncharacterized protein CANTEDRAFT_112231 [Yamadazyma tenuis ATCC 10573]EGV66788.1 hypothetical protein CANTEDRAFT_112231 [Yamadazyma tenuis ATCC 10573]EGV66789.1 hypothetical protein CANTEDRAFT_112231 [Yamadazyma tenuis ATCC 10573]WEJ95374.1 hypothetical protein PSN45_002891 [Yamadazyma tenuis]
MAQYKYTLQEDYSFAGGIPEPPFTIHKSMQGKLDPKYVEFFNTNLAHNSNLMATHRVPLQDIRASGNVIPGQSPLADVKETFDIEIPRVHTSGPPIPARVFVPNGNPPAGGFPLFIWYHGGGWVLGGISTENSYCTNAAELAQCVVVTVDYRLAPEDPFPACVDDAYEAAIWGLASAPTILGINGTKVAVGGSSAGGNLTAIVTNKYASSPLAQTLPPLAFQVQVVPVTDNTATAETQPSWGENEFTAQLPAEKMLWYRRLYLPNPEDAGKPESSPLFYSDESMAKVPPCFIAASECDILRSEAEAYAAKLKKNGVDTTIVIYKGMPHTTMVMDAVMDQGRQLVADTTGALKKAFYG